MTQDKPALGGTFRKQTPDEMCSRVDAMNFVFVDASRQLGEFESGITVALLGAMPARLSLAAAVSCPLPIPS